MKKILIATAFVLVFVFLFSFQAFAATGTPAVVVTAQNGETMEITATKYVFYLPSTVDITKLSFNCDFTFLTPGKNYVGSIAKGTTVDITPAETTDALGNVCYKLTMTVGGKSNIYTFYHEDELASVFVTTSKGLAWVEQNKNNRDKESKILVLESDGTVAYSDADEKTSSEIKGRGNATFSYYKKPYQIKLGKKTKLLGMEKSKTWILLANYTDQSALHNALAFTLGDALNIPYNIDYRFVNLYIDGEYRGLYMLCEKVQVDESRVDIVDLEKANETANAGKDLSSFSLKTETGGDLISSTILTSYRYAIGMLSPKDITGGYLVELDNNYGQNEPCYFQTENGNIYVVKSPEYASKDEVEYIAKLFADMEEAIFSETGYNKNGVHYSEYIDMESFAGVYTVQELMKNWDAYTSSMFFFKDADENGVTAKIYMGPLWDLDNTLGNINYDVNFGTDTAFLWAQNGVFKYPRDLAKKLMTHEDFRETVAVQYDTAYHAVQEYLSKGGWFEASVDLLEDAVAMDRIRWKLYDGNNWLLNSAGRKSSVKFVQFKEYGTAYDDTQDTALGFMRYYLSSRVEALLMLIGNGETQIPEETSTTTLPMTTTLPTTVVTTTETTTVVSEITTEQVVPETTTTEISTTSETSKTSMDNTEPTDTTPAEEKASPTAFIVIGAVLAIGAILVAVVVIKKKK